VILTFSTVVTQIHFLKEDKFKLRHEIQNEMRNLRFLEEVDEKLKFDILRNGREFFGKDWHEKGRPHRGFPEALPIPVFFDDKVYLIHDFKIYKTGISIRRSFLPTYFGFGFLILLGVFHFTIIRSLKPLKNLEKSIRDFGNGNLNVKIETGNNDEVGRIAQEFSKSAKKIRELEQSRELFLRNIIHELKTPITKGKLAIALFQNEKGSDILNRAFNRLDSLINEMANVEKLTSNRDLCFQPHRLSLILEEAIKLGFLQKEKIEISEFKDDIFEIDLNLFSIAFKNLLDNGIKYSENQKVEFRYENGKISFSSLGAKLEKDFSEYVKPFNHSQITSQRGFGLGLYITNEILERHNFKLNYRHSESRNIFEIRIIEA
jgi:two-component system OmpR family sensor kinase